MEEKGEAVFFQGVKDELVKIRKRKRLDWTNLKIENMKIGDLKKEDSLSPKHNITYLELKFTDGTRTFDYEIVLTKIDERYFFLIYKIKKSLTDFQ